MKRQTEPGSVPNVDKPDRQRPNVVFLLLFLGLAHQTAAAQHSIVNTAVSAVGSLTRTEYTVQASGTPLDRFQMVRLEQTASPHLGVIFFLPPLGSSFAFYEQPDTSATGRSSRTRIRPASASLAGFFAHRGYDVYGYSPRYSGIPAGSCEAGIFDCSVMSGWDIDSMLDDIAFIRNQIESQHPGTPIVIGGASLGAMLAIAVANDVPGDYDGVLVWEGMLSTSNPAVLALNAGYCAALQAQLAGAIVFDGISQNLLKKVISAAEIQPGGGTIIPLFPAFLTNHEVLVLSLASPPPGPVSMPVPGFVSLSGSLADEEFLFASEQRLSAISRQFSDYLPLAALRDISCSLAGVDSTHVASLGSFSGSVLAIGGGLGFGSFLDEQLDLFSAADVSFILQPDFGHMDHFMSRYHRAYVEGPILSWVSQVFGN